MDNDIKVRKDIDLDLEQEFAKDAHLKLEMLQKINRLEKKRRFEMMNRSQKREYIRRYGDEIKRW